MKIVVCIPARYKSTRLPGKPLLKINGKTIINHVYDRVNIIKNYAFHHDMTISDIVVLTDQQNIFDEVNSFGGKCCIIEEDCVNGTDRVIHYLRKNYNDEDINDMIIVNVQGDEPYINPDNIIVAINNYIDKMSDNNMVCSTIHYATRNEEEIRLKSRGKMVLDNNNNIMYCSRNIIPSCKNYDIIPDYDYYIHIGVFVFRASYLLNHYFNKNEKLQLAEDIEWMKIMVQGFKINSVEVKEQEIGVDTIDDYNYLVNKYIL
jgi:3-deoxy-manno-octulosonate cytidylyltransferase (CMP-KDO synthetase)